MTTQTQTKAQQTGISDATTWLDETPAHEWEEAIAPGQLRADEGLINGLDPEDLADALGFTLGDAEGRDRALDEYNNAWDDTVRAALTSRADEVARSLEREQDEHDALDAENASDLDR